VPEASCHPVLYAFLEEESVPAHRAGVIGVDEKDYLSYTTGPESILDAVKWGADGFGKVVSVTVGEGRGEEVFFAKHYGDTYVFFDEKGQVIEPRDWDGKSSFGGDSHDGDQYPRDAAVVLQFDAQGNYQMTVLGPLDVEGYGENWAWLPKIAFNAQDGDGDKIDVPLVAAVQDDKPGAMAAESAAIVEDEQLNPPTDESNDANPDYGKVVTGDVSDNGNWGADGFDRITQIKVGNVTVNVPNDHNHHDVTVYWSQTGVYQGTNSSNAAASLKVESDGDYTFTLRDNMLIRSGQGELIDTLGKVTFTGVDKDGDPATIDLTLKVMDDMPQIINSQDPVATTYTLALTNYGEQTASYDNSYGYYIKDAAGNPTIGKIIWDSGHAFDSHQSSVFTLAGYTPAQIGFFIIPNGDDLNSLSANTAVHFIKDASGQWQAVAGSTPLVGQGANVLFDVASLNGDAMAHYKDNSLPGNQNWEDLYKGGDLDWNDLNIQATWTSSTHSGTTFVEGSPVATGKFGFLEGADGASVTAINNVTLSFGEGGYSQSINIGAGSIQVKADGTYKFTPAADLKDDVTSTVTYTVTDGDGDIVNGYVCLTTTDRSGVDAVNDSKSIAEGYWQAGANMTLSTTVPGHYSDVRGTPVSIDDGENDGNLYLKAEPGHPVRVGHGDSAYYTNPGSAFDTSVTFTVVADASHKALVSYDLTVAGLNQTSDTVPGSDWVKVELLNSSGTVVQTMQYDQNSLPHQTFEIAASGTYSVRVSADDNSEQGQLWARVDNLEVSSYSWTSSHTYDATAPGLTWVNADAVGGNVMVNDDPGSEGARVSAVSVNGGSEHTLDGTPIVGHYGSLTIDEFGNYTYTPNQTDNAAGAQDVFTYRLVQPDGDTDTANLTISVANHSYSATGTNGNDLVYGSENADTLSGGAGNDHLVGLLGNDRLEGGTGNDIMTGGDGSDTFVWKLNDTGNDFITDFNLAPKASGGDVLDLSDLLTGESATATSLDAYLHFEAGSGGKTVITVDANAGSAGGTGQTIVLDNVSFSDLTTYAGGSSDQAIIQALLDNHNLKVTGSP